MHACTHTDTHNTYSHTHMHAHMDTLRLGHHCQCPIATADTALYVGQGARILPCIICGYHGDEQPGSLRGDMVLVGVGDIQWGSIVPPLDSGVRDSIQVGETVKKGKSLLKDSEIHWGSLDDRCS